MIKKIDIKFVVAAIACFVVAFQIISGTSGIKFADPINEMFTFALVSIGGIVCSALIKR
jgi:energy-converting hydrogenase Eha subunit C